MTSHDQQPATPPEDTPPLRVGVIGCGPVGAMHAEAVWRRTDARLVGLCAPSPANREPLARRFATPGYESVERLLEATKPDVVCVASPDPLHVEQAIQCLRAGAHVFCEKPLGSSLAEAAAVARAADEHRRFCGVNYNRRYAFGYRRAFQLLRSGAIGELRQVWLQVTDATPPANVATRRDVVYWTLLGHHFDLIRQAGGSVRSVSAMEASSRPDSLVTDLNAQFFFASGALGSLSVAYRDGQTRTTERCELVGTTGGIVVDDVTRSVSHFTDDPDRLTVERPNQFLYGDAFYRSLDDHVRDFFDRLAKREAPSVGPIDAVESTRLAEAAIRSSEAGGPVTIERADA
ncbi:Gfo/Idh/MocA family oxidoreductase [Botrimarina sp.]|uniref:Gfo/Idh/MocA family protein n=1 Tax=Botrimarina sp. TaxID=2795802 RepID=UPI0032F095A4